MSLFSSKSESETQIDPMRRDQVVDWQNRYHSLLDRPFEFFPGQTYAGLAPEQEAALGMREDVAAGLPGGIMAPTMGAWETTLTAPDVASNPYVNAMLGVQREQAMEALGEDILPMLKSRAVGAGPGGLGSSRQGVAEGRAVEETMDALTQAQAATQLGAYGQGLAQQRYGIGAAPGMAAMELMPSDIMMGVGDVRRGMEQLGIDEEMARHEFEQQEPWTRLERFTVPYQHMSAPYTTTKATQETTPSALQIGGQLAGLGLTGTMAAGAMGFGPAQGMFSGAGGGAPMMAAGGGGAGGGGNPWRNALAMNTINRAMPAPSGWGMPSNRFGTPMY